MNFQLRNARTARRVLGLGAILTLGLMLAACQPAAPEATEAPPAAPEAPAPTATEEPMVETEEPAPTAVKIGVLNPATGGLALFGDLSNQGIRLYFDNNPIEGVDVELVFADTAGDPQQALDQARRLVEQEEVDFLMGLVNSAVIVPLAEFADEAQVPLLTVIAGAQAPLGSNSSPYVFRTGMANGQQDRPLGWYTASELGMTQGATAAWDFLVGVERAGGFSETFTAAGGTLLTEQKPPLGTTDYGPFLSQIDPSTTEVVYGFFAGPGAIAFLQQMNEFGLSPDIQVVASGYFTAGVLEAMGATADGLVQASQYTPVLDNPENLAFLELYDAQIGGEPGVYVEEGYLGAEVAARVIEIVGGDLSDVQAFLDALAGLEFSGPSGPIRFDENGQSVRNVYITRVVIGEDGTARHEMIDVIEDVTLDWAPE